jgi:arylsulfatase A-like enzyme
VIDEGSRERNDRESNLATASSREENTMKNATSTRREFLKVTIGSAAALATVQWAWAQEPEDHRPNVILLMSDDQEHTAVGYAGSFVKTPVLDEMAKTGLRFNRFYSPAASCAPSRASFLTGRTPNRTGVPNITYPINLQERCLPTLFKERGYFTAHVGKWHLGNHEKGGPVASGYHSAAYSNNHYDDNPRFLLENSERIDNQGESSEVAVRYALHFVEQARKQNKPFFITVWFGSPHNPHKSGNQYRELYKDRTEEERNWAAEITGMDVAIGQLRDKLKTDGLRDNTLIWFSGDNGHPKGSVTRSGIRVPSVAEWPARWKKPHVVEVPCSQLDYLPTFASILGVQAAPDGRPIDGLDITDILDGKAKQRAAPLPFWHAGGKDYGLPKDLWDGTAALVDDRYELYVGGRGQKKSLLDLEQDPTGGRSFEKSNPEQVQKMTATLEAFQKSVMRSVKGEDYPK